MATDRILLGGRSVDASISKQIPTDDGYVVTNGFVVVHSPVDFGVDTNPDLELGNRLRQQFLHAYETEENGVYTITDPFPLRKVAISLRSKCKLYQVTNKYKQTFITFYGENCDGDKTCGTFNLAHLLQAFECVGRKAIGILYKNDAMFNGDAFMLVEPEDNKHNLTGEINAVILQSRCPVGV